jgi:hypothetical protein
MTATTDEWPPSPEELLEDPQLLEAVRETDPDYLEELSDEYPELSQ